MSKHGRFLDRTTRGYNGRDVLSVLQKSIRRGDARLGCYFALELLESGAGEIAWGRLLTISAEDCAGIITQEIEALWRTWQRADRAGRKGRVFLSKAVLLLAAAKKSRDADHAGILLYDQKAGITEEEIAVALEQAEADQLKPIGIPEYAHDLHTAEGRRRGKTKADFIREEQAAMAPRVPGLFDGLANR